MGSTREEVIDAILAERDFQDEKWGPIERNSHSMLLWSALILEEVYEVIRDIERGDHDAAKLEMVQVAAVAFCALETHGAATRNEAALARARARASTSKLETSSSTRTRTRKKETQENPTGSLKTRKKEKTPSASALRASQNLKQAGLFPGAAQKEKNQEKPDKPEKSDKAKVTEYLMDVFTNVSSLQPPASITYAAQNKLWWQPLYEIFTLCEGDLQLAAAAVRDAVKHMQDEELTISRPMSILNVARSRIARGAHKKSAEKVEGSAEDGLWI